MNETSTITDTLVIWKTDIMSGLKSAFESMSNSVLGTTFSPNMSSGELEYDSDICDFHVNEETGNLEWEDT